MYCHVTVLYETGTTVFLKGDFLFYILVSYSPCPIQPRGPIRLLQEYLRLRPECAGVCGRHCDTHTKFLCSCRNYFLGASKHSSLLLSSYACLKGKLKVHILIFEIVQYT